MILLEKGMKFGGLFSGGGGFEYAAQLMGWDIKFTCEIDDFCNRILKYYFPNAAHHTDIRDTDFTQYRGRIDVLTGGFPCQPYSVAGKRKGAEDDRYLWPETLRAVRESRPAWFIGENVAGITSMVQPGCEAPVESQASLFEESDPEKILEQEFIIETICGDLEREGYSVQPVIIPACSVGAPHKRERIWIIAHSSDARTESLQRKWENGVYRSETSSNSTSKGLPDRIKSNGRTDTEKDRSGMDDRLERSCNIRTSSDTHEFNGDISGFCSGGLSQLKTTSVLSYSNAQTDRFERRHNERAHRWNKQNIGAKTHDSAGLWNKFPTVSPVCSGNDGFSDLLDFDALFEASGAKGRSRKRFRHYNYWRAESVKLFGNAIVPQVGLEIFKAIEKVENELTQQI